MSELAPGSPWNTILLRLLMRVRYADRKVRVNGRAGRSMQPPAGGSAGRLEQLADLGFGLDREQPGLGRAHPVAIVRWVAVDEAAAIGVGIVAVDRQGRAVPPEDRRIAIDLDKRSL